MSIANPAEAVVFNTSYDILGEYVSDDSRVPYYNPLADDLLILPGEPILIQFGAAAAEEVMMAQGPIRPGEIGILARYFTGDFPCNFSADVVLGAEVYWDFTNSVCSLVADVTNGFVIGNISYALSSQDKSVVPTIDGSGRVVCATSTSTKCRIISRPNVAATTKGTVTILGDPDVTALASNKKKTGK